MGGFIIPLLKVSNLAILLHNCNYYSIFNYKSPPLFFFFSPPSHLHAAPDHRGWIVLSLLLSCGLGIKRARRKKALRHFHVEGTPDFNHHAHKLRYVHHRLSRQQSMTTTQQHLYHSPYKSRLQVINTGRQLNNATGAC